MYKLFICLVVQFMYVCLSVLWIVYTSRRLFRCTADCLSILLSVNMYCRVFTCIADCVCTTDCSLLLQIIPVLHIVYLYCILFTCKAVLHIVYLTAYCLPVLHIVYLYCRLHLYCILFTCTAYCLPLLLMPPYLE